MTWLLSAGAGALVILAVRNLDKGIAAADRIAEATPGAKLAVQRLDLGSLQSIRAAADVMRTQHNGIDLLINNAGLMNPTRSLTTDGFESQLASTISATLR